jgi:hypothetical protein
MPARRHGLATGATVPYHTVNHTVHHTVNHTVVVQDHDVMGHAAVGQAHKRALRLPLPSAHTR